MNHRRIHHLGAALLFGVLVIGSSIGVGRAQPSREATPADAVLELITDSVELQNQDADTWQAVEGRVFVKAGDTIQTDSAGTAMLVWFEDGTMVELGPDTVITVNTFQISTEQPNQFEIEFSLVQGRVINAVNKLRNANSRYEITTPSVQLAVRGTKFAVDVDAEETTTLVVHEGVVAAQQGDVTVDVPAGHYLQASTDHPIETALPIASANANIQAIESTIQTFIDTLLPDASAEVNPSVAAPVNVAPPSSNPVTNTVDNTTASVNNTVQNTTPSNVVENTVSAAGNVVNNTTSTAVDTTTAVTETVTSLVDTTPIIGTDGLDVGSTVTDVTDTTTQTVTTTVDTTTTTINQATTGLNQTLHSLLGGW